MLRHLIVCAVCAVVCATPAYSFTRSADSLQLVALYNSTQGASWSSPWNLNQPMTTWQGVILNASGKVVELNLSGRNLTGRLPNLQLPELLNLVLFNNSLRDSLPPLSGLTKLRFLDINNNDLDGRLHDFVLPELETMRMADNQFSGEIPNFSRMPKLTSLVLTSNSLSGQIPLFNNLVVLRTLRLNRNQLSGPIPDFPIPNLLEINLANNLLEGSVPGFGHSGDLFTLDLSHNRLSGFVPSFNRLRLLETLRLNNNQLTGPLNNLSLQTQLRTLDLSNNFLDGRLTNIVSNRQIVEFNASGNTFSGRLPSFEGLNQLQRLFLSRNEFSDTLPDLSYLPALTELRVDSNFFSATVFDVTQAPALQSLRVEFNRFTFEDLFALNATGLLQFAYAPQRRVPMLDTIFASLRDNVLIDLMVDEQVSNNTYTWYLNDEFLTNTALNRLFLPNINALNEGTYYCVVRNNSLPALSLFSEELVVVMDCPFNEVVIVDTICAGDTLFIKGVAYTETGSYRDTIMVPDPATCDSILVINLVVFPVFDVELNDTICESDQLMFGGQVIARSGTYVDTLQSVHGCDSVVTLHLVVHPAFSRVGVSEICAGDTLFVGHLARTVSGIYFDTLQTIFGCDSVIITDLTVLDTFLSVTEVALCMGESYEFRGNTYTRSGTYFDALFNRIGCDSTYVLRLTIGESDLYPLSRSICQGDSVVVGTSVYRQNGTYRDTLISHLGCDSIVVLTLSVVTDYSTAFDFDLCRGDTLRIGDRVVTAAGIFIDSLVAQGGCDSIVRYRVNFLDFITRSQDMVLCFGDSLVINDNVYASPGVYRDTLAGARCDTVLISRVSVADEISIERVRMLLNSENVGSISPVFSMPAEALWYEWSTGATTVVLDSVPAGSYAVTVSDVNGCSANFEFQLDLSTSVRDHVEAIRGIRVFPNPARSAQHIIVEFDAAASGVLRYDIVDLYGRIQQPRVLQIVDGLHYTLSLDVPAVAGVYFLRLVHPSGGTVVRSLVVVE